MSEKSELKIIQGYLAASVAGAVLTAAAALACFYTGYVFPGLMFCAFFFGILDVMFRKVTTTTNSADREITVTDTSLWHKPRTRTYHRSEIRDILNIPYAPFRPPLQNVSILRELLLLLENGGKIRLKILHGKKKAESLRTKLLGVLEISPSDDSPDDRLLRVG